MANPYVTRDRVDAEVRTALAATLRTEADAIEMDTSIINGLHATSIDFLDINFRLEGVFGIQMATQLILDHAEEEFGEGKAIDRDNKITPAALTMLKAHLGDLPGLEEGMYADEIPATVTPKIVADGVAGVLAGLPESCTHCSASAWKSEDGAKVLCGECSKEAVYPDGDTLTKRWLHDVEKEKHLFSA